MPKIYGSPIKHASDRSMRLVFAVYRTLYKTPSQGTALDIRKKALALLPQIKDWQIPELRLSQRYTTKLFAKFRLIDWQIAVILKETMIRVLPAFGFRAFAYRWPTSFYVDQRNSPHSGCLKGPAA